MPAIVRLRLHDDRLTEVDLDRLSPRARALAEAVASAPLHVRHPVTLESAQTLRELGADPLWHGPDLDRPHRTTWAGWSFESPGDPYAYMEREAAKLPLGYTPVGWSHERVPSADAARAEAHLIGKAQVLGLLAELGRPLSAGTLDNYRSHPPAGWPQPARYIGRTPQWDRRDIEVYAGRATT